MEISKSIFALTKNNNGFFKSEKQAAFLIAQMKKFDACVGYADSGYNSCPIFASWDEKGIIKLAKSTKHGESVMFERKLDGILTSSELKYIKSMERRINQLEKRIKENEESFNSGKYDGSGDASTYSEFTIYTYQNGRKSDLQFIENLKNAIDKINSK